jgi:NADPH-dependent ferric siderophore reductase
MLPAEARVDAHILSTEPAARIALRAPRAARIAWHTHDPQDTEALVRLAGTPGRDSFVWAAGERGAITALRAHLTALDHPRDLTDLSNYWTLGEAAKD